ncbi:MAG: PTS sugar transporter subunit IIA [Candidatus Omnitrophica bacterium]|nr:PTS sugar transporter subunit IIA [Candidatus Omnitrophota bacterium]
MLQHLLREESVKVGFEAASQEEAIRKLIDLLPSWGLSPEDRENVYSRILAREGYGTTAIGEGIALPHCIFAGVSLPLASLGISREGIDFPSLDGLPVHIAFLLVLPDTEDAGQMKSQILHSAGSFFRDRFWRERLKIAGSAQEAYELIVREAGSELQMAG